MSTAGNPPGFTPQVYLERERSAEVKSEFEYGRLVERNGADFAHCQIVSNLLTELGARLDRSRCRVVASDLRVRAGLGSRYYYPDLVVACEPFSFLDDTLDTLLNPRLVVEVLSPSTESRDRGEKLLAYMAIPSILEILLVSSERRRVEVFRRTAADDRWTYESYPFREPPILVESVGGSIDLDAIYAFVPLSGPALD